MLANDARILLRSAVATAVAGIIMIAVGAGIDGGRGALGSGLGVLLVAAFFSLSVLAVSLASRFGPAAMMGTALGTYVVKILAVAVLVVTFRGTAAFNNKIFGFTAIVCILVWSAGQVAALARSQTMYVNPDRDKMSTMPAPGEADEAPGEPGGHAPQQGQAGTARGAGER